MSNNHPPSPTDLRFSDDELAVVNDALSKFVVDQDDSTEAELSAWQKIRRALRWSAARRIRPDTATLSFQYAHTLDPYGEDPNLPPELQQVGRAYFLFDPDEKVWVLEWEVRELHPDVSDAEWRGLMRRAAERDEMPDPLPLFHKVR